MFAFGIGVLAIEREVVVAFNTQTFCRLGVSELLAKQPLQMYN